MTRYGRILLPAMLISGCVQCCSHAAASAAEKLQEITSRPVLSEEIPVLSAKELDVVEHAFRSVLAERRRMRSDPYFLTPKKGKIKFDVSDDFLKRFADLKIQVRKNSDWKQGAGTRVFVDIVQWVSETEVEVRLGLYRAPMSAMAYYPCRFRLENGKWKPKDGSLRPMTMS